MSTVTGGAARWRRRLRPGSDIQYLTGLLDRLQRPQPRVQLADLLGEQSGTRTAPHSDSARIRTHRTGQQAQQRCLTTPVAPDETHPIARAQPPRHIREQLPVTEAQRHVLDVEDVLPEAGCGKGPQTEGVARGWLVSNQGVGRIDSKARLGGPGRRATAQPGQLLAEQVLAPRLGGVGSPGPLRAGQHIRAVAALVGVHPAVDDLPDPLAHLIEKPPVVRGDEEPAAPGCQLGGEPRDAFDVKMVGGLVQYQQVQVVDEQRGQGGTPTLPTGGLPDEIVQTVEQTQPAQHRPATWIRGPHMIGYVTDHGLADGRGGHEPVVLREDAHAQRPRVHDPTGIGVRLTGQEL